MPTAKQRKAVEKMVENGGNVSKSMREARYSIKTAKTPKKLTESKGYREVLEEYGLTEGLIAKALVDDIKAKPKQRTSELSLGADILGMKQKEEGKGSNTLNIIVIPPTIANRHGVRFNDSSEPDSTESKEIQGS